MDAKLTLKLNQKVIDRAKEYASNRKQSLSRIVEAYLRSLTGDKEQDETEITPFVQSMTTGVRIPEGVENSGEYHENLLKKHK